MGCALRRAAIARTARTAIAVYVPSRFLAQLAADLPRVRVVPLGVDRELFRPAEKVGNELLCVADFYPHKRHDLLLEAYASLPERRPPLRLLGNPDVDRDCFQSVAARASGIPGVIVDGRVSLRRLLAAYRAARIFVIASEHESFLDAAGRVLVLRRASAIARDRPGPPGKPEVRGRCSSKTTIPRRGHKPCAPCLPTTPATPLSERLGSSESNRFSWKTLASRLPSMMSHCARVKCAVLSL